MDRREFLRLASLAAAGFGSAPFTAARGATTSSGPLASPWQPGVLKFSQGRLLLGRRPFTVRGVVYQPTPVGEDPTSSDSPFSAYSDSRIWRRDFSKLQNLGANVIRLYQPREIAPPFFRDALDAGLYVMLGFNIDTRYDLTADWARRQMLAEFRQFIRTWRGQPSILFWALGNGVNAELRRTGREGHLKAWHSLADAMAKAAHQEEGGEGRPVVLISSEIADIGDPVLGSDDASLPNLDLWGVNAYRGPSFGSLFDDLKTTKPALITEYGLDTRQRGMMPDPDQIPRAQAVTNLWNEIAARPDKAVGGCVFEFTDEWWRAQPGRPDRHEWGHVPPAGTLPSARGHMESLPNGIANLEWFGLYGVTRGVNRVDILSERPVVRYLRHAWSPVVTLGRPAVWFDVPLNNDPVDARQRISGRYAGLKPGWEIFLTVQPVGSPVLFVQPESAIVRDQRGTSAGGGSWILTADLGPESPPAGLRLELNTLVARTPAAAAALRDVAQGRADRLPPEGLIGGHDAIRVRRR